MQFLGSGCQILIVSRILVTEAYQFPKIPYVEATAHDTNKKVCIRRLQKKGDPYLKKVSFFKMGLGPKKV